MTLFHRALRLADGGLAPCLDLVIRLYLAQIFWISGLLKITSWENALQLARNEYPVSWLDPGTAAVLGVSIELICPILLAFGLATRLAVMPMIALSLVIQYAYLELPEHLFWAILLGWFLVRGAGALSLDRMIGKAVLEGPLPGRGLLRWALGALDSWLAPLYQIFIRFWMAEIFWTSGQTKIASWDTTVQFFAEEYRVPLLPPELAATLATATELAAPILLLFGLGARFAAVPLIAMTLVIQFTYLDKAEHWLWLMALGLIALRGAGPLSIDRLIDRALRKVFPELDGKPAFSLAGLPRVVVVGAGFGGLAVARALACVRVQVTVIDRRNYHLFQPLLYQVATASLSPADIATPIREILREQFNTRVLLGRVSGVDTSRQEVRIGERAVPYDYLVLATGARHAYFGKDEWEAFAPGIKKVDDATAMRGRILSAFERAEASEDPVERERLLTFVLVGGGPTGVELAGAIAELARLGMDKDFRNFDPAEARVILVQSGPRVLPSFPETLSASAQRQLEGLGVEVRCNSRVEQIDEQGVIVSGERIAAGTVLWSAGVMASPAAKWLKPKADKAGRVEVGADFAVPGLPNVFVIGDTASATDAAGTPLPGLAPAAKQAGAHVAKIIASRLGRRPAPAAFRYANMGNMATIGRKAAIADFGFLRLSGALAWWLWGIAHVGFLVGGRNRMAVALDWFWAYLTFRRGSRLITGKEQ